jgi:hypothetical protein
LIIKKIITKIKSQYIYSKLILHYKFHQLELNILLISTLIRLLSLVIKQYILDKTEIIAFYFYIFTWLVLKLRRKISLFIALDKDWDNINKLLLSVSF